MRSSHDGIPLHRYLCTIGHFIKFAPTALHRTLGPSLQLNKYITSSDDGARRAPISCSEATATDATAIKILLATSYDDEAWRKMERRAGVITPESKEKLLENERNRTWPKYKATRERLGGTTAVLMEIVPRSITAYAVRTELKIVFAPEYDCI